MENIFLEIFNISLTASLLIVIIVLLRLISKRAPKQYLCLMWSFVGIRLMLPLSLLPSIEVISPSALYDLTPAVDLGLKKINQLVNPVFSEIFASSTENSVNPLQVAVIIASRIWLSGVIIMCLYGIFTLFRHKKKPHIPKAVAFILLCLYWFNPIIWVAYFFCLKDLKSAYNKA